MLFVANLQEHSQFYMPWSYLVAIKGDESSAGWHRTAPEIEIQLRQRLRRTKSGAPVLKYVDADTLVRFQTAPKEEGQQWELASSTLQKWQRTSEMWHPAAP